MGVTGSDGDFRLTKNPNVINDSTKSRIFIDGPSGNMGIGTDVPRAKLEVNGNVVLGHQITFGGVLRCNLVTRLSRTTYICMMVYPNF